MVVNIWKELELPLSPPLLPGKLKDSYRDKGFVTIVMISTTIIVIIATSTSTMDHKQAH